MRVKVLSVPSAAMASSPVAPRRASVTVSLRRGLVLVASQMVRVVADLSKAAIKSAVPAAIQARSTEAGSVVVRVVRHPSVPSGDTAIRVADSLAGVMARVPNLGW